MLSTYLKSKRYLVVLDDVWDIKLLQEIRIPLLNRHHGSRIMLTTRKKDIAYYSFEHGNFFNNLPNRLKPCFLYCALFPEDYLIKRKRLIRLWIAEGFVEPIDGVTPEEVAESYLVELIVRSMLQVEKNEAGRLRACKMHDLVRELALSTSKKEKFGAAYVGREIVDKADFSRLSIQTTEREINSCTGMSELHSFLLELLCSLYLMASDEEEFLRVNALRSPPPDLQNVQLDGKLERVPLWLGSLQNLTRMSLPNLERLMLSNAYVGEKLCFSRGFIKLKHLVLGYFPLLNGIVIEKGVMPNLRGLDIACCLELQALPQGIEFLASLERLNLYSVPMQLVESVKGGMDHPRVQHIPEINLSYKIQNRQCHERLSGIHSRRRYAYFILA
ncbi:disease resistance protein RPM1-like [Pyrus ussuriensis x Pyrus communis]|uniref:Disease resistance protein RPM1-like n=1 Tax=Pyrus ussuriensis x Pyrus communis TaxID=2448454 RepID=A0A5N5I250_9ROSA|nr:disease resistance protein RPM1-like [Pyrus ussuriensis x Pyrus communis]